MNQKIVISFYSAWVLFDDSERVSVRFDRLGNAPFEITIEEYEWIRTKYETESETMREEERSLYARILSDQKKIVTRPARYLMQYWAFSKAGFEKAVAGAKTKNLSRAEARMICAHFISPN